MSGVREYALSLAAAAIFRARYGRGFDDLPPDVRDAFEDALVRSLERDELLRALAAPSTGSCAWRTAFQTWLRRSSLSCAS